MKTLRVIAKEPGKPFTVKRIPDTLEDLQKAVGGYIEVVHLWGDLAVVCNEEGRLRGLPYNVTIDGVSFVGDILLVGTEGEEFEDIDDDFINDFKAFLTRNVVGPYTEED